MYVIISRHVFTWLITVTCFILKDYIKPYRSLNKTKKNSFSTRNTWKWNLKTYTKDMFYFLRTNIIRRQPFVINNCTSHWKALGFVKTIVNNKVHICPPSCKFFLLQLIWMPFVIYFFLKIHCIEKLEGIKGIRVASSWLDISFSNAEIRPFH